jgi:hypothetical protein
MAGAWSLDQQTRDPSGVDMATRDIFIAIKISERF